jgi:hypothetical protein
MIDVGGNDRPATRDLAAHELCVETFAQRNERHLRRDLAATCVVQLRDGAFGRGP